MITPNFFTKQSEITADYGKFVMDPLPMSFGHSLGNALRRTLLSSLEGVAVTQIKIEGVPHLFTSIKGVKESALDIMLNLKQLRFVSPQREGSFKINLEFKGAGKIYGKDLKGEVDVVNTDLYIAEITDSKSKLQIEAIVETGVGAIFAEEQEKKEEGFIAVDAYFSPIKKVNFKIEEARVGRKINFDRLILEIWTDGGLSPEEALKKASTILSDHITHILSGKDTPATKDTTETKEISDKKDVDQKLREIIIDELNLPSRVINALLRENIETVADLIEVGRDKLIKVKGLGKKSFVLIEEELQKMGIEV